MPLAPDQLLHGRYRLQDRLGEGTQAVVWAAIDQTDGTPVAVKCIDHPEERRSAHREVALLRLLRLPGIVRILDDWDGADGWFVVMEHAKGRPFPPCSREQAQRWLADLLLTLSTVHARGIVHGDLKPSNVFVDGDHCLVLDFGLALDQHAAAPQSGFTPRYAAPEVAWGGEPTPGSDLYSVGILVLEALGIAPDPPYMTPATVLQLLRDAHVAEPLGGVLAAMLGPDRPSAEQLAQRLRPTDTDAAVFVDPHRFESTHEHAHALHEALGRPPVERWLRAGFGIRTPLGIQLSWGDLHQIELAAAPTPTLDEALGAAVGAIDRPEQRWRAWALACWAVRDARGREQERRSLEVLVALALHTESEAQIHAAELECSRASLDTTDLRSWLRSALEARFRGRFELARTQADGLPTVLGAPLDVAVDLVHTWGLRDRPDALLSHLDARAAQFPRDHRYTTWITRWRRLALYQRGDYLAALACALDDETTGDLCNRAACLIELGRAEEAIDVASRAEGLALVDRSPFLSAQARWLVRYSHCRARRPLPPDAALVDDAETFSIQHAALFAFTDAVAAWRLGRPTLASTLADRAQALFRQRNRTEPALLAGAFRCFLTRDTAGAQRLLPFVPAESRSDAVIQAMALLRAAGLPTVTVPASPRPTTEWDWHLDVLSIRETLMLEPLDAEDQEESESHPRISAAR